MNNVSLIPARLKSGVVGDYVTSADQIIDEAQGKSQQQVNSEIEGRIVGAIEEAKDEIEGITQEKVGKAVDEMFADENVLLYGAGDGNVNPVYESVVGDTPKGTYTLEVLNEGDILWFIVPPGRTIEGATINGEPLSLKDPVDMENESGVHKLYESTEGFPIGKVIVTLI